MTQNPQTIDAVVTAFNQEFGWLSEKFEIIDLLANSCPMDSEAISQLKLPSAENNIVWHPGVYVFIGNSRIYRVGVSMINSRQRVMQHLDACTSCGDYCVWDIEHTPDRAILLFNVKKTEDRHWLMALEVFLESKFQPAIPALRVG